jgi:hypothetical protein
MAKNRSKFARLPFSIRESLNTMLLNGVVLPQIVEWLFEQTNTNENQPCAALWTADAKDLSAAKWNCQAKLYEYLKSDEFTGWAERNKFQNDDLVFTQRMEQSLGLIGDDGDTRFVRSLLLEVAPQIRKADTEPEKKADAFATITRALVSLRTVNQAERKLALLEAREAKIAAIVGDKDNTDYAGKLKLLGQVLEERYK